MGNVHKLSISRNKLLRLTAAHRVYLRQIGPDSLYAKQTETIKTEIPK